MFATLMLWPAVTATPFRRSVPAAVSVVMVTAVSVFAGVSFGSVKPKLAAVKV